jgi:hypothetical protein
VPRRGFRTSWIKESVYYFRTHRAWWLLPLFIVFGLLGTMIVLGGSHTAAVLVYALF